MLPKGIGLLSMDAELCVIGLLLWLLRRQMSLVRLAGELCFLITVVKECTEDQTSTFISQGESFQWNHMER